MNLLLKFGYVFLSRLFWIYKLLSSNSFIILIMLHLKSSIDGFKVILGGLYMNAVIFLTLIIAVRPPEYPDERKTTQARNLYIMLVIYHLSFCVVRYLSDFVVPKFFRDKSSIIMILAVAMLTYLC